MFPSIRSWIIRIELIVQKINTNNQATTKIVDSATPELIASSNNVQTDEAQQHCAYINAAKNY
jgi:hypothetical protein